MNIGIIGLGNLGEKLANNLVKSGNPIWVLDLDLEVVASFVKKGAKTAANPAELTKNVDYLITCLPSPKATRAVIEGENGAIHGMKKGLIWAEMSTTGFDEITRWDKIMQEKGVKVIDCPVTGGVHKAESGNISILVGCDKQTFDDIVPVLSIMGHRLLHTGAIGTASQLKVMTNYLATANLISCCEALAVMHKCGIDLATTYDAIRISSGNSFVHETESQLILNGSRMIHFTHDLVLKDVGYFQGLADKHGLKIDLSPVLLEIFEDAKKRYGGDEQSDDIIRRLEEQCGGFKIIADGFPAVLVDNDPKRKGEVVDTKAEKPVA